MIVVAGHLTVAADQRDSYITAHRPLMEKARAAPGCADFAITADPLEPGRVNLFELWSDRPALDAWRKRARGPKTAVKPTGASVSLYEAGDARPPFGKG